MAEPRDSILLYESALNKSAHRKLRRIGSADILIGIPSHRNGRTIGEVLDAVARGIASFLPDRRVVLMNADGGSSDSTVRHVRDQKVPRNLTKFLTTYEGPSGKGNAVRAILEAAVKLRVKACLVLEARAPGITPEWLPSLLGPVLQGNDMVFGCYQRSAYAASLTDNLVYPFLRTFLNADLREPLAGEFCVSGSLAADLVSCDVWETNVSRFGLNAWLAIYALTHPLQVLQVDLGYRGEGGGEPGNPLDQRFLHIVGTLFRLLATHRRYWESGPPPTRIPFAGQRAEDRYITGEDHSAVLLQSLRNGADKWKAQWQNMLSRPVYDRIMELVWVSDDAFDYSDDLWAQTVMDAALEYNLGEGDPDKVVEALLPLYYGRTVAYIRASRGLSVGQREQRVRSVLDAFQRAKILFRERWDASYEVWEEDDAFYWGL